MTQILAGIGLKTDKIKNNLKKRSTEATVQNMKMIHIFQPCLGGTPGMMGYGMAKAAVHQLVKRCMNATKILYFDEMIHCESIDHVIHITRIMY